MSPSTWLMLLAFISVLLGIPLALDKKRKYFWYALVVLNAAGVFWFGVQAQNKQEQQAKEIADMATGGDSFCYLGFLFAVGGEDRPSLNMYHNGKYPLQNVRIAITDMELLNTTFPDMPKERSKARPNTVEELEKFDNAVTQFTISSCGPPGLVQEVARVWRLPKRDQATYSIQIFTQFQTFYQHLKMRKVNGSWSEAYRVIKHGPNKEIVVLLEKVPSNFPRDQSGKVNWLYE